MKLDLLNEYLDRDESVALAFLFGSRAKKMEREVREASDWDIGVYFKPTEYLELETEKEYPGENKIWADIVDILKTDDVDFVVLNRASPSLVYNVLRVGLPLTIKDKVLYLELLRKVSYEAMDWWDFVNDFWEISQRAKSIPPEERARLQEYLSFLEKEFGEIDEIKKFGWEDYQKDSFKRKIVERWVENLIMGALDTAKIVLACENREIPQSYKDILKVFIACYVDSSIADKFSEFSRLRNIIVYRYLDVKWQQIRNFIKEAEILYPAFIQKIKDILRK
ncbi:MAG: HepT-like ribonuclease domain-containing protein [Candidatus Desantisbacteria bacterium]